MLNRSSRLCKILEEFSLESLQRPVKLEELAKNWGVTAIETQPIASEAMLLPGGNGYKIVLKELMSQTAATRQRFSFAHELGHFLLQLSGFQKQRRLSAKHSRTSRQDDEEILCDQIAAEILMPRFAFEHDAGQVGWSLNSLRTLAKVYDTSIPATARRMVGLMAEACVMAIWNPAGEPAELHRLEQRYTRLARYGVPSPRTIPRQRLCLIDRALSSQQVQCGIAPIVDKKRPAAMPPDVPAEAWAWGRGQYQRVMMYYYPELNLRTHMEYPAK